jgi:ubiquinone/menaquinone biosynthesis C-methylase UbiE
MKPNESAPDQLMKYIVGRWISKPIYVAAALGIADLLSKGPKSIDQLARETGAHAPSLYRVMRALASVGTFSEKENKIFELTPIAEYLKAGSMRSIALMFNSEWSDRAWEYFLDGVKTGETPFNKAHGMPVTDWLEKNPQAAVIFNEANAIKAAASHRAIIDEYNFSEIKTLTDVGGGVGILMAEILKTYPSIEGIVFDIPPVINEAKKVIKKMGLQDRCQALEGDFFKSVPSGSDAYLLSNILHDWPDDRCHQILSKCHSAMKKDSRLLVMEMIVPLGNEPSVAKLLDLEMMVITGGRERTETEFEELFRSSGFEMIHVISTPTNVCVIEAEKKD